MPHRSRALPLVAIALLAACEAAPTSPALSPDAAVLSRGGGRVAGSVTGHHQTDFGTPAGPDQVRRHFSFGALLLEDGSARGNFQVMLHNIMPGDPQRNVTFEVNCLRIDGNEAWVGGTIKAPKSDIFLGGYDIWHVVDGGQNGADSVEGFIGVLPFDAPQEVRETLCHLGPAVAGLPRADYSRPSVSQAGEIHVRDDR